MPVIFSRNVNGIFIFEDGQERRRGGVDSNLHIMDQGNLIMC